MTSKEDLIKMFEEGLVEPNDFALQCNAFLDKMKQSSAYELVKSIKKFVTAFMAPSRPPQPIEERVAEVRQFLDETSIVIEKHPLWRGAGEDEIEMAAEALERYLMHKVFKAVYSPDREDDARRDREFLQRLNTYAFIQPHHLDIKMSGDLCEAGWKVACSQLRKMDSCKSPRDKVTCVMNCCTVLNKLLLRYSSGNPGGADDLLPNIIYSILRARPAHWYSDVRYIQRFRHPGRLSAEAGYYMTQMMGAVAFLERLDAQYLSIDPEEFERLSSGKASSSNSMADSKAEPGNVKTQSEDGTLLENNEVHDGGSLSNTPPSTKHSLSQPSSLPDSLSCSPQTPRKSQGGEENTTAGLSDSEAAQQSSQRNSLPSDNEMFSSLTSSQALPATASLGSSAASLPTSQGGSGPLLPTSQCGPGSSLPTSQGALSQSSVGSLATNESGASQSISVIGRKPPRQVSTSILQGPQRDVTSASVSERAPLPPHILQEAGIVERFLECRFKEMTIGDVSELLKNYRILVHKYCILRSQVGSLRPMVPAGASLTTPTVTVTTAATISSPTVAVTAPSASQSQEGNFQTAQVNSQVEDDSAIPARKESTDHT